MDRLLLALALIAVAVAVSRLLMRRPSDAPTQPRYAVPTQLDRADFADPEKPWLAVVFTSDTCDSCATVVPKVEVLASGDVAVDVVPYQRAKALHQRYAIDVVPLILVADSAGEVKASFVGTPSATDLWAAVAEVRAPGSSPEPDFGRS